MSTTWGYDFECRLAEIARIFGIGIVITRNGTDGSVALGWRISA